MAIYFTSWRKIQTTFKFMMSYLYEYPACDPNISDDDYSKH